MKYLEVEQTMCVSRPLVVFETFGIIGVGERTVLCDQVH